MEGDCFSGNWSHLRSDPRSSYRVILEHHEWTSHTLGTNLARILLHEALGYDDVVVSSLPGGDSDLFERLARGWVHINAEVWTQNKQAAYNEWVVAPPAGAPRAVDMNRHLLGLSGWFVDTATSRKHKEFPYFQFSPALADDFVVKLYRNSTWRSARDGFLRDDSGAYVCPTDAERLADGLEPAGCVNGVYTPPQCQDGYGGGGPGYDGTGPCIMALAVTADWDGGLLQQMARNLGLNVSVGWVGSSNLRAISKAAAQRGEQTLFYWYAPDPHLALQCTDAAGKTFPCFTRVAFPESTTACHEGNNRRPDGTVNCDFTSEPLATMAWSGLETAAPEAYAMMRRFGVSNRDLDAMFETLADNGGDSKAAACTWLRANVNRWRSWVSPPRECSYDDVVAVTEPCVDQLQVAVNFRWPSPKPCVGGVPLPLPTTMVCSSVRPSMQIFWLAQALTVFCVYIIAVTVVLIVREQQRMVLRRAQPGLLGMSALGAFMMCGIVPLQTGPLVDAQCVTRGVFGAIAMVLYLWPIAMKATRLSRATRIGLDTVSDRVYLGTALTAVSIYAVASISMQALNYAAQGGGRVTIQRTLPDAVGVTVEDEQCLVTAGERTSGWVEALLMIAPAVGALVTALHVRHSSYNADEARTYVSVLGVSIVAAAVGAPAVINSDWSNDSPGWAFVAALLLPVVTSVALWQLVVSRTVMQSSQARASLATRCQASLCPCLAGRRRRSTRGNLRAMLSDQGPAYHGADGSKRVPASPTKALLKQDVTDIRTVLHRPVLNHFLFTFMQRSFAAEALLFWRACRLVRSGIAATLTSATAEALSLSVAATSRADVLEGASGQFVVPDAGAGDDEAGGASMPGAVRVAPMHAVFDGASDAESSAHGDVLSPMAGDLSDGDARSSRSARRRGGDTRSRIVSHSTVPGTPGPLTPRRTAIPDGPIRCASVRSLPQALTVTTSRTAPAAPSNSRRAIPVPYPAPSGPSTGTSMPGDGRSLGTFTSIEADRVRERLRAGLRDTHRQARMLYDKFVAQGAPEAVNIPDGIASRLRRKLGIGGAASPKGKADATRGRDPSAVTKVGSDDADVGEDGSGVPSFLGESPDALQAGLIAWDETLQTAQREVEVLMQTNFLSGFLASDLGGEADATLQYTRRVRDLGGMLQGVVLEEIISNMDKTAVADVMTGDPEDVLRLDGDSSMPAAPARVGGGATAPRAAPAAVSIYRGPANGPGMQGADADIKAVPPSAAQIIAVASSRQHVPSSEDAPPLEPASGLDSPRSRLSDSSRRGWTEGASSAAGVAPRSERQQQFAADSSVSTRASSSLHMQATRGTSMDIEGGGSGNTAGGAGSEGAPASRPSSRKQELPPLQRRPTPPLE